MCSRKMTHTKSCCGCASAPMSYDHTAYCNPHLAHTAESLGCDTLEVFIEEEHQAVLAMLLRADTSIKTIASLGSGTIATLGSESHRHPPAHSD